ncbi:hypothetical protein [Stigmatella erecta]|uniref:Uncharacterized protein n=1 Tax=Stigmatella erecta TaxID=83460 RepID=A0A1I0IVA9_9BACT|nr:hypothetical protein [Stigmatella erecta]SEU01314.1 hypothetical protein SAMN05443639_106317 [Stigmatella erecta]
MAHWSGAVSPGNAPAGLEFLATSLAKFPDVRLSRVQVQRQEGYSDGSGWDTPPSIQVNALLEFPDNGIL